MKFTASHRYARISARKMRPLATMIRGKNANVALDMLRYQPQRGARMIEKVLKSALGNAQDPDRKSSGSVNVKRLFVEDVRIDGGPIWKRIMPRSRGTAYPILKRTAHISVVLSDGADDEGGADE